MIRKTFFTTASLLIMLFTLFVPAFVYAQAESIDDPIKDVCLINPDSSVCKASTTDNPIFGPKGIITRITKVLGYVVGVVAVFMIIFNGLKFVLSNGNSDNVSKAKNGIIFAIIGILVALFAEAIAIFVLQRI